MRLLNVVFNHSRAFNVSVLVSNYVLASSLHHQYLLSFRLRTMSTSITYLGDLIRSDPQDKPVFIIGQLKHLNSLQYSDIECKVAPRVSEEVFKSAIAGLHPGPTDTCSLYLNLATISALPLKCSRHNTPSRAHAISRLVTACSIGVDETVVIVCEKQDVYASGCAVARAYPLYSKRTVNATKAPVNVSVEFIIVPSANSKVNGISSQLNDSEISALQDAAHGIRLAARIVDTPCNEMNVDSFLEEVKKVGDSLGITPYIIRGEELNEKGFGGIYGVGKAAVSPPALAVLSHKPSGATTTVAWVGKGIVYDTGGLSIKGKSAMPGMKRDCGGAAGVLGAFYAVVKAKFNQNLHAVFCLAENAVGPAATRPDDIHTLYSGKTVEINNTDAEGRLVLSDGVAYANKDLKANIILDMATLTGAQAIATGKYHAAVLTNTGNWEGIAVKAGLNSGDLIFPIPYTPELHFCEFSSAIADMKNSVGDRANAQASCAGLFINSHLGFDFPGVWVHVDMASPVHLGERATGYGVALLSTMFGSFCSHAILTDIAPELDVAKSGNSNKKQRKN